MKCLELTSRKDTFKCEMCGTLKKYAPLFFYVGQKAVKTLCDPIRMKVCQHCAMREEFGSKYKQNKGYKRWIENQS